MYQVVATFNVPLDLVQEFIAAALEDGRDSRANECGTTRLELIEDEGKDDLKKKRFFLIDLLRLMTTSRLSTGIWMARTLASS